MGIFNEQAASTSDTTSSSGVQAPPGPKGPPGFGFNLDANNNFNLENKKIVNAKPGTGANDVVTKSQIQLLDSASPGTVVNDKAVIYSSTGSLNAQNLYLKDAPEDGLSNELRMLTPHQSYNNIHLKIPDLKNFDGFGGRRSSEMMIKSVDQTVTGKKTFQSIEVPTPTSHNQASNKYYVDQNFLNRLTGGQIGGDLDMRGHTIKYLKLDNTDSAAARVAELNLKADLSKKTTQTFQGRVQVPNFNSGSHLGSDIVNLKYMNDTFLNKKSGGTLGNSISFISSLPSNQRQIFNIGPPRFGSSATNKTYVDAEIAKIPQSPQVNTSQFIKKDGTVAMTADLDLGSNKITNLKTPTSDTDVANKSYIDKTLSDSHLVSSSKTNAFVYLDLDDTSSEYNIIVNAFTNNFRESPIKIKKPSKSLFKKTLEQIIIDQEWVLISIHSLLEHIR